MDFLWFGTIAPPKRSHGTEGVQRRFRPLWKPIPGNRPPFRIGWPVCSGISGRFALESPAGFVRNTQSILHSRVQSITIDYVKEESHVLREQIGNKPLRLPIPRDGGLLKRPSSQEIQALVVRMAKGDPTWGYIRIRGTLHNQALKKSFGFRASRSVFPRSGFRFLKRWDYNSDYLRLPNEPLWKEH